jgi:hypothetical protein
MPKWVWRSWSKSSEFCKPSNKACKKTGNLSKNSYLLDLYRVISSIIMHYTNAYDAKLDVSATNKLSQ